MKFATILGDPCLTMSLSSKQRVGGGQHPEWKNKDIETNNLGTQG